MQCAISLLLIASSLFAKSVHAPLPPEAYQAKTIAIVNHSGTQTVTDRAYEELQKWGRFTVVNDPARADIILVVGTESYVAGARASTYGNATYINRTRVVNIVSSFILKGHQEPFFSETERAALFRKSATKRCIDDFKKRIEKTSQP